MLPGHPACSGNATGCGKCPSVPSSAHGSAAGARVPPSAPAAWAFAAADDTSSTHHVKSGLGSPDSDIFSKDGLARFPSMTLHLYHSPNARMRNMGGVREYNTRLEQ